VLCYAGAILCKEIYIPLPLPLLLLALRPGDRRPRELWLTLAGCAAVLAVYLAMRVYMLGGMGGYQARLLPNLAEFSRFWDASPRWVFGAGLGGLLGLAAGVALAVVGLHQKILSSRLAWAWAVAAVVPILPVIHSMPVEIGQAYFVPHRYVFSAFMGLFVGAAITCAAICPPPPQGASHGRFPSLPIWLTGLAFAALSLSVLLPARERACLAQLNRYSEQAYGYLAAGRFDLGSAPDELRAYFTLMDRHIAHIKQHEGAFANEAAIRLPPPRLSPSCLHTP